MRILFLGTDQDEFRLLELVLSKEFSDLEFLDMVSIWDPLKFGKHHEAGFDLVLLQQEFEWRNRALSFLRKQSPEVPIVILAEPGQEQSAVEAIRAGASDFLIRSSKTYLHLPETIRKLLEQRPTVPVPGISDARIQALMDRAGIGWFQARLDGRLVQVNQALLDLLGAESLEQLRNCGLPVMGPRPLGAFNERGELSRQVTRLKTVAGGRLPALVTELILLDADGAMIIDGLVEDTRNFEARGLAGAERPNGLEDPAREFASMVAHELRQPLRAARDQIESLAETFFSDTPSGQTPQPLAPLVDQLDRIRAVIGGLSQLARVGAAERRLCDSKEALSAALMNLNALVDETGARLRIRALPAVRAEPTQLTMLFQNLLANALHFRGEGSPVIDISARQEGTDWVFTVRDNGIGFEADRAETVFEPFRKLDPKSQGSGIGLTICKTIVKAHGGRIWAESSPGRGAAFHFTLPLLDAGRERDLREQA